MKITGIKKAVGQYKELNKGGQYSPVYGRMMLDRESDETWVDEFCSIGHTSFKRYDSAAIIDLVKWASDRDMYGVTMSNVKAWAEQACEEFSAN